MNKLVAISGVLFLLASCNGSERSQVTACTPIVRVTMPSAPARGKGRVAATPAQRREVVQVYWDVSRSMRNFAVTRDARTSEPAWTDDLTPVVSALDSSVLLRAHAKVVEQYGVGERIESLSSARSALRPVANRTALHLAAEQLGTALANGSAQAALVISDMELDTPPRASASDTTVCRGVPLPSTREAGSLFGRCFESAVVAFDGQARTRASLLVHVFRKSTHDRELFILLFATDRAFGRRISDEVGRKLDFTRHVIFDSGAVAAASVGRCQLAAPEGDVLFRNPAECGVKCFDARASIQAQCDVRRAASGVWIQPVGRGLNGAAYEALAKKPGDEEEHARVRFTIPCGSKPGRFDATVSFHWRERTPWSQAPGTSFAARPGVRDLFDSLTDAVVRIVPTRRLHIGMDLGK